MKFSICNETWRDLDFTACCERVSEIGYDGIEVAPFMLAENPEDLTEAAAGRFGRQAADAGLDVVGLHWLLSAPPGMHIATPNDTVRSRTIEFAKHLTGICAAMGGSVMVWGSPPQRMIDDDWCRDATVERAVDTFRAAAEAAGRNGVTIALEPLARRETNFINTAVEGVDIIKRVDHPAFRLHLDVKAMSDEAGEVPDIIRANRDYVAHFHANDPNLLGPGMGDVDYGPIVAALDDIGYDGWASVEVFDYSPGPDYIARRSLEFLQDRFAHRQTATGAAN